jgi:hypothetical protein
MLRNLMMQKKFGALNKGKYGQAQDRNISMLAMMEYICNAQLQNNNTLEMSGGKLAKESCIYYELQVSLKNNGRS